MTRGMLLAAAFLSAILTGLATVAAVVSLMDNRERLYRRRFVRPADAAMNRSRCTGHSSLCDGQDLRPVRFSVEPPRIFCAGCRSTSLGQSAKVVGPAIEAEKRGVRAA